MLKDLMMWKGCHQDFGFDFSFSMLFISNSHLECTIAQRRLWKWLKLNLEAKWHRYRYAEDSRSLKKGITVPGEKRQLWLKEAPSLPEVPKWHLWLSVGNQDNHMKSSPDGDEQTLSMQAEAPPWPNTCFWWWAKGPGHCADRNFLPLQMQSFLVSYFPLDLSLL